MKTIYELVSEINKFTKKSFGHKTNKTHIAEVREDEPQLWSRLLDYSERPYISIEITQEEIYNDLNKGRE
jgi:hypothetical protein